MSFLPLALLHPYVFFATENHCKQKGKDLVHVIHKETTSPFTAIPQATLLGPHTNSGFFILPDKNISESWQQFISHSTNCSFSGWHIYSGQWLNCHHHHFDVLLPNSYYSKVGLRLCIQWPSLPTANLPQTMPWPSLSLPGDPDTVAAGATERTQQLQARK